MLNPQYDASALDKGRRPEEMGHLLHGHDL